MVFGEMVPVDVEVIVWFLWGGDSVEDLVEDRVDFEVSVKKNYLGPCQKN